jgi:hypothetical protein
MTRPIARIISSMVLLLAAAGHVRAGVLFGIDTLSQNLVTIDTTTGAASTVGSLGITGGGEFRGLAFDSNGTLFGVRTFTDVIGQWRNILYAINTSTGEATELYQFGVNQNRIRALAFDTDSGKLLAASQNPQFAFESFLVSIDVSTASPSATTIGSFNPDNDFPFHPDVVGLAFRDETLFGLVPSRNKLLTLDTTTGKATGYIDDLDTSVGAALAYDNNAEAFFTIATQTDELLKMDPDTGQTTVIGSLADENVFVVALAFQPESANVVPEPASASLVLLGLAGLAVMRKRKTLQPEA